MTDKELDNMPVFRKANRCFTLYELLCETLGLDPLSPTTTWQSLAKAYSLTMEESHKLQQTLYEDETTKDQLRDL